MSLAVRGVGGYPRGYPTRGYAGRPGLLGSLRCQRVYVCCMAGRYRTRRVPNAGCRTCRTCRVPNVPNVPPAGIGTRAPGMPGAERRPVPGDAPRVLIPAGY